MVFITKYGVQCDLNPNVCTGGWQFFFSFIFFCRRRRGRDRWWKTVGGAAHQMRHISLNYSTKIVIINHSDESLLSNIICLSSFECFQLVFELAMLGDDNFIRDEN